MLGVRFFRQTLWPSLLQQKEKLKAFLRQRDRLRQELEKCRSELATLRAGMEGLAHAHGRLLRNYNDQVQHNRALERRLQPADGGEAPRDLDAGHLPLNARGLDLGAFPPLSASAATTEKLVSTRYGFIFVSVPKAASRSILEALWQIHGDGAGAFIFEGSPQELFTRYPAFWSYLKIAVVRHPFRRAVSCYIDKVLDADSRKKTLFRRVGLETPPASFAAFVDFLGSDQGKDELSDRHWTSQAALLGDIHGNLWIDRFARQESLEGDLQSILDRLGLKLPPLRKVNERREHLNLADGAERQAMDDRYYHTPEIEAQLRARYRADYELFGYRDLEPRGATDQNPAASSV
jgi:hypothetical protein